MTDRKTHQETAAVRSGSQDATRSIGGILVMSGRISEADVEKIQKYSRTAGIKFGDAALHLNLLTREDVEYAIARQFNYPVLTHGEKGEVTDDVVAAYSPQSRNVEELRTVRSRLSLGWLAASERNVLAIVSPDRNEGRSWFAANLATVFAQAGERTLLIDADLRNPRQHHFFKLQGDVGLSELLTGRAGKDITRRIHPHLRLYVAPAGRTPPNPQELIGRPVFDLVLDRFAKHFDLVIVDTPAATETADADLLAARAGAALVLTRVNHTRNKQLRSVADSLRTSGVKLVGSVVNDF